MIGPSSVMELRQEEISAEAVSNLVGRIYDCAIDPEGWSKTLSAICDALDCANGALLVVDLTRGAARINIGVGVEQPWEEKFSAYAKDIAELAACLPPLLREPVDEPAALMKHVDPHTFETNRYLKEWAQPQGLVDLAHLTLIRDSGRFGSAAFGRHQSFGPVGDRELRILRLLAPHLRRAVTISDLLDMRLLEKQALEATVEELSVAILLVGEDGEILHANPLAKEMLGASRYIQSVRGRLSSPDHDQSAALLQAIEMATNDEATIGGVGIGLPLRSPGDPPAIAHVLPLSQGAVRTRLAPRAVAAVFITDGRSEPPSLEVFAKTYGLTPAEEQLLEQLLAGETLVAAAGSIGVSVNTAKSHLSHIFTKTGVNRQADLVALIHRLGSPLRGGTASA